MELSHAVYQCVCVFSEDSFIMSPFVLALAKHPFICVHFRKTVFHVSAPAKHHLTQLTFQRDHKFPLELSQHVCTRVYVWSGLKVFWWSL